ncbi:MAG TPA: helix-hairpin-helix domain-containing protein [Ramlibacter sp.]|uniref:ComEA family DNA-binding protein n=1 Tax=Ramlibacter sp. TaxID=1917967 RepID=UPI002D7F1AFB|nr:helix-hairpin-helix domain-containing protein [Ramlibacter sp.]HET8747232.1 helix-hairpin-helix domain-containing protein [Ramlibacter sp.]
MKYRFVDTALMALAAWTCAGLALAADAPPRNAAAARPAASSKAAPPKAKAAAPQKAVLVDINSASKQELKTLPGIADAEADRIIAGRPYLSKAHLQTRGIVSPLVFQGLRDLVVARQKDAKFGKAAK